jgi:hypothetical protein
LHGQSVVPVTESEFGGQPTQTEEFRQFLYFPAPHETHGPKFGPVDPAAQKQVLSPAIETVPCGHDKQVLTLTACTSNEYMFTAQSEHATEAV